MESAEHEIVDADIDRTVTLLGGPATLHRVVHNRLEAHDLISDGLPVQALWRLVDAVPLLRASPRDGLEKAVGLSRGAYQKRGDKSDAPLSPEQSGRAWKFAEILGHATTVFGSQADAEAWLERPAMSLDQRRPIDLLSTPAGVEAIEEHLGRLDYGVYT